MQNGPDLAFCPLKWLSTGGRFGPNSELIHQPGAKGNCKEPYECGNCKYFRLQLSAVSEAGVETAWLCSDCTKEFLAEARKQGKEASATGYYHEGRCQGGGCRRPLEYSPHLQLCSKEG